MGFKNGWQSETELFFILQRQRRCKYRVLELHRKGRRDHSVSYVAKRSKKKEKIITEISHPSACFSLLKSNSNVMFF